MTDTTSETSQFDWSDVTGPEPASTHAAASGSSGRAGYDQNSCASKGGEPFPQGFRTMYGRMPIQCDTAIAIMQLPDPIVCIKCAMVFVNSGGGLCDCDTARCGGCPQVTALSGQPINDQEIKICTDARGDKQLIDLGWVPGGNYPGAPPQTRPIQTGVPYVEAMVVIGPDCGPCVDGKFVDDQPWPQ